MTQQHQRSRRRRAARSPAPPKDRHAAAAAETAPRAPLLRGGENVAEPLPGREPLPSRDTQLIESPHVWITEKAKVDAEVQYSTVVVCAGCGQVCH